MFLREIIWKERLASKIESKHGVVPGWALPISARDMTAGERKHHEQAKKS